MDYLQPEDLLDVDEYCQSLLASMAEVFDVQLRPFLNKEDVEDTVISYLEYEHYDDVWNFMWGLLGDETEVPLSELFGEIVEQVTDQAVKTFPTRA